MLSTDARHGKRAGYVAHRRDREDACAPCLAAEAVYQGARYRRNRSHTRTVVATRACDQCGFQYAPLAGNQAYCGAECRSFARNQRRREASRPLPVLLNAIAYRFGAWAPKVKVVKCWPVMSGDVAVMHHDECPNCGWFTMVGTSAHRVCRGCATEVVFNSEEWDALHAGLLTA